MYNLVVRELPGLRPVSLAQWGELLMFALALLVAMEAHKRYQAAS